MLFQREKKELWRYASKNYAAVVDGMNSQTMQLQRYQQPQHLHWCRDLSRSQQQPQILGSHNERVPSQSNQALGSCCGDDINKTLSTIVPSIITPCLPYSSVPYGNNCYTAQLETNYSTDVEIETLSSASESNLTYNRMYAIEQSPDFNNIGQKVCVDVYEQSQHANKNLKVESYFRTEDYQRVPIQSTPLSTATISPTTFASTAANIFRNCCCGGFFKDASTGAMISNKHYYDELDVKFEQFFSTPTYTINQYFNALMSHLKRNQVVALLKAIKSRLDLSTTCAVRRVVVSHCILIPRVLILGEEPYVIACRLFFWPHLKCPSQLKRLPDCPNEADLVYICCNPLHWCRILETETAPPPYHHPEQVTVTGENSHNDRSSNLSKVRSNNSTMNKIQYNVGVQRFQKDDIKDYKTCSMIWCQVAYWELSERVGARYLVKTPSISIYSDTSCGDEISDGMCLTNLAQERKNPSPEQVQYVRQKIGLGITLSQETDGFWLFNRSIVPIFVHSPTLSESWFRVCRITPGDCLKVFDSYRAKYLTYPVQVSGAPIGPVDKFSVCISFGKGWGCTYKRQDITKCPCWLEVLFTQSA